MRKRRLVTGMLMVVVAVGSMAVQGKISHNAVRAVAEEKENIAVSKGSFQFGSIPVKNKIYNRKDLVEGKSKYSLRATIPESYDARNEGVVTDVKNQGNYATCWSFAALGSAESGILKKGMVDSVDLSELQLAYAAYNKLIDPLNLTEEDIWYPKELSREVYNYAGSRFLATRTLARWQGAVQENDASYMSLIENEDAFPLSDELMYQKDAYHLKNTEFVYLSTPNRVKETLLEKGCATLTYHSAQNIEEIHLFENEAGTAVYTDPKNYEEREMYTNHDVLLVGWDDNYEVSNFNKNNRPNAPGAWLVKGSWGTNHADNGYYWISYEDAALNEENAEVAFFDMDSADNYDKNYQYDGSANNYYLDGEKVANVFTSESREKLEAVSLWTAERNVSYEINVYREPDESNPESGEKVAHSITGVIKERGYHTVDFTEQGAEDISLSSGERFAVVVKLFNEDKEDSSYAVECVSIEDKMVGEASAGVGESFIFCDGAWNDCNKTSRGNICLKAFTSVVDDVPCEDIISDVEEIKVDIGKSKRVDYQLVPANATGMITWKSEDSRIVSVSNGVVFGNAVGNTAITGTIHGHSVRVPVTVEERPVTALVLPETKEIYTNQKAQLVPIITPTDTTDQLTWYSSDPLSVRVDSTGEIFAIKDCGNPVTVMVMATSGEMAQCEVMVRTKNPYEATLEDMQSQHPYMNDCETYYEYARENATSYRVTFSEDTRFESDFDFLYILDEKEDEINKYTGNELAGKTITIHGSRIKLKLYSDKFGTDYGFQITKIEPLNEAILTPTPTMEPTPTPLPTNTPIPTIAPVVLPSQPKPSIVSDNLSNVIVKSMAFKSATKNVKVGKKVKLSKYLKVRKKTGGKVKITYQFTKKKYKKYATLSKTGVLKAKKKGRKKTVVVRAKAGDGSGKSAKIRLRIR